MEINLQTQALDTELSAPGTAVSRTMKEIILRRKLHDAQTVLADADERSQALRVPKAAAEEIITKVDFLLVSKNSGEPERTPSGRKRRISYNRPYWIRTEVDRTRREAKLEKLLCEERARELENFIKMLEEGQTATINYGNELKRKRDDLRSQLKEQDTELTAQKQYVRDIKARIHAVMKGDEEDFKEASN